LAEVPPDYDHVDFGDSDTIYTCSDPKTGPQGTSTNMKVKGSFPPQYVPTSK